jgi:hypothetical protein
VAKIFRVGYKFSTTGNTLAYNKQEKNVCFESNAILANHFSQSQKVKIKRNKNKKTFKLVFCKQAWLFRGIELPCLKILKNLSETMKSQNKSRKQGTYSQHFTFFVT